MRKWAHVHIHLVGVILFIFAASAGVMAAEEVHITLRDGSIVTGSDVLLGQVASITGADRELVARLGQVVVGVAPVPGLDRSLSTGHVEVRLRQAGFSTQGIRIATDNGGSKIAVRRSDVAEETAVENATAEPQTDQGRSEETVPVWVVKESVTRLEVVAADNLERSRISPHRFTGTPVIDPDQIKGMRASRFLRSGRVLTTDDLEPIPLVTKGEKVTLKAVVGAVEVSVVGIAQADGNQGDVIPVTNARTDKEVPAVVSGPGEVEAKVLP